MSIDYHWLGTHVYTANKQSNLDRIHNMKLTSFRSNELTRYLKFSVVGKIGEKISGGQRQQLGIAKALITKPKLLILDDATSSLDSQVENSITESINSLSGNLTTIVVAHRLSKFRNSDLVVFLEDGKVLSTGRFEHVKNSFPTFSLQAKLIGL